MLKGNRVLLIAAIFCVTFGCRTFTPQPKCLLMDSPAAAELQALRRPALAIPNRADSRSKTWRWTIINEPQQHDGFLLVVVGPSVDRILKLSAKDGSEILPQSCGLYQITEQRKGPLVLEAQLSARSPPKDALQIFTLPSLQAVQSALSRVIEEDGIYYRRSETPIEALRTLVTHMEDLALSARALTNPLLGDFEVREKEQARTLNRIVDEALDDSTRNTELKDISRLLSRLKENSAVKRQKLLYSEVAALETRILARLIQNRAEELTLLAGQNKQEFSVDSFLGEFLDPIKSVYHGPEHERCSTIGHVEIAESLNQIARLALKKKKIDACKQLPKDRRSLTELLELIESLDQSCRVFDELRFSRVPDLKSALKKIDAARRTQTRQRKALSTLENRLLSWLKKAEEAALGSNEEFLEFLEIEAHMDTMAIPASEPTSESGCLGEFYSFEPEYKRLYDKRQELLELLAWLKIFRNEDWVEGQELPSCVQLRKTIEALDRWRLPLAERTACRSMRKALELAPKPPTQFQCESLSKLHSCFGSISCPDAKRSLGRLTETCELNELKTETRTLFRTEAQRGGCAGCRAVDRRMSMLQNGGPIDKAAASQLKAEWEGLRETLGAEVREVQESLSCKSKELRVVTREVEGCCDLTPGEYQQIVGSRRDACCQNEHLSFEAQGQELERQFLGLEHLQPWPKLQQQVESLRSELVAFSKKKRSPLHCDYDRQTIIDQALRAQESSLLGDDGLLESLLKNISNGQGGSSRQVINRWIAGLGSRGEPFNRTLSIIVTSRELRESPIDQKPAPAILRSYEWLRGQEAELSQSISSASLRRLAEEAIIEAKRFMAPFDQRILTVELDANGFYQETISIQRYEIGALGRLLKLEFDTSLVLQSAFGAGLASLEVEFFTDGFTVSARNSDGSPSQERFGRPGDPIEGLAVFAFKERLSREPGSGLFYRIDPSGVGSTLILRVVPQIQ